eukprot:361040-Chlamydomonas_euryale.AAC.2
MKTTCKAAKPVCIACGWCLFFLTHLLWCPQYSGDTVSEGGFQRGRVSAASVLDIGSFTDKKGREYYTYELLTRTADGNEGGRHQLVKATVADGKLWILLVRVGDKRWVSRMWAQRPMLVFAERQGGGSRARRRTLLACSTPSSSPNRVTMYGHLSIDLGWRAGCGATSATGRANSGEVELVDGRMVASWPGRLV